MYRCRVAVRWVVRRETFASVQFYFQRRVFSWQDSHRAAVNRCVRPADWQSVSSCVSGSTTSSWEWTRRTSGMWPTAERWRLWRRPARWSDSTSAGGNRCLRKWWRSNWWKDPKVTGSGVSVLQLQMMKSCWIVSARWGALVKSLRASWLFRREAGPENKASVSTETS